MQPEYISEDTLIFRECPVKDCTEVLEANSHSGQIRALHDHLSDHEWHEKQRFM